MQLKIIKLKITFIGHFQYWKSSHDNLIYDLTPLKLRNWKCILSM